MIQAWAESFDWQSIDTVLLDMDGTLLDLNFDTFFWLHHLPKRYSQRHQLEEQQATADVHQRLIAKRGTLDWYLHRLLVQRVECGYCCFEAGNPTSDWRAPPGSGFS